MLSLRALECNPGILTLDLGGFWARRHAMQEDLSELPDKAFSKPTAMQRMTKSVGREWYMPLVGLMREDSFSKQCS